MMSVALSLVLAAAAPESASVPEASTAAPGLEAAPRVEAVVTQNDEAFQIGSMLRCPVCQGMPISESPSTMAQDMMKLVRQMLAEGKSRDAVLDYFVQRYGEWVLLEPKAEGANLGLWALPAVALLIGLFLVIRFGRPRRAASAASPGGAEGGRARGGPSPAAPGDDDPYLQALRKEVDE